MSIGNGGISFGIAKTSLATVVDNGVCTDDPRVMSRTNEAILALLAEIIPVNGMATYDVVASGTTLLLPKELENAIEAHPVVTGGGDVAQGWYDIVNPFTYVDPSMAHDNPLVDLFLVPDPGDATILRRKYDYPGLTPNATVRVTGAKRYLPITGDGDYLLVQNVRAVKLMILAIEKEENNEPEMSERHRTAALSLLQAEVKKHQLDPRNSLARKAAYQLDLTTYGEGTLGRTRSRLALELPGFLLHGKSEITYFINRAVQLLVDHRNQLNIAGRIGVHGSVAELAYVPANVATDVLIWSDYNQIRLLVQSFVADPSIIAPATIGPDGRPTSPVALYQQLQGQAYALQQAQLTEAAELARHAAYTTTLNNAVVGSLGWMTARYALEAADGLRYTTAEIERAIDMSEMRLMERGMWKGTIDQFEACVKGGRIGCPVNVEAVLAFDVNGRPLPVRSIFFEYQENGPGK